MGFVPNGEAGGDLFIDQLVQLLQFQTGFPDADGLHTASNIYAHQIGHHRVGDGHGGADGAACSGMDVGHQPNTAARCKFLVAQLLHLCNGGAVHHVGKNLSLIIFSFDLDHKFLSACQR